MIETLDDWNSRLACYECCGMAECAEPRANVQQIVHRSYVAGFGSFPNFFLKRRTNYSGGGNILDEVDFNNWNSMRLPVYTETVTPPATGVATSIDLIDPFTLEDSRTDGIADMIDIFTWLDPNPLDGNLCAGVFSDVELLVGGLTGFTNYDTGTGACGIYTSAIKFLRWRWRVPLVDVGKRYTYYKITWDVVFFPADSGTPSVVATDQTWENELEDDPESEGYYSEWYELGPSEEAGEFRVVNVRYNCYRSVRYGTKPEITGEGFVPPP